MKGSASVCTVKHIRSCKRGEESDAGGLGSSKGSIAAGRADKAKQCINAFFDQLLGVGSRLGCVVAIVQRPQLNSVPGNSSFRICSVKEHFCAIEIGQADLVCCSCQGHRLPKHQFACALDSLRPRNMTCSDGASSNAGQNNRTTIYQHDGLGKRKYGALDSWNGKLRIFASTGFNC